MFIKARLLNVVYDWQKVEPQISEVQYIYDNDAIAFENKLNEIKDEDNKIDGVKSVYFSKLSKFPRTAINDYNIKRRIKPEKADAIIYSIPEHIPYQGYIPGNMVKDVETGELFIIREEVLWYRTMQKMGLASTNDRKRDLDNIYEWFFNGKKCEILSETGEHRYFYIMELKFIKEYQDILNFKGLKLLDSALRDYINNQNEDADADTLDSIEDYIKSNDSETVVMGLNLLYNFNVKSQAVRIGELLLNNNYMIITSKEWRSAKFDNMLSLLGITKEQFRNYGPSNLNSIITIYSALIANTEDPEDGNRGRLFIVERIQQTIIYQISPKTQALADMGIRFEAKFSDKFGTLDFSSLNFDNDIICYTEYVK
jgi:hypothetical protein